MPNNHVRRVFHSENRALKRRAETGTKGPFQGASTCSVCPRSRTIFAEEYVREKRAIRDVIFKLKWLMENLRDVLNEIEDFLDNEVKLDTTVH